jgi:hypothetical protein
VHRPKRPRARAEGTPLSAGLNPNDLWCTDYKGEFQLGDKRYCYPHTVTDSCLPLPAVVRSHVSRAEQNQTTAAGGTRPLSAGLDSSIACREFGRQSSRRERRKLLELVVDGAVWKDGRLEVTLHEPLPDFGTIELCKCKKRRGGRHFIGRV